MQDTLPQAAASKASPPPPPPRIIQFEGRTIQVPADFTEDEIVQILNSPTPPPGGYVNAAAPNPSPNTASPDLTPEQPFRSRVGWQGTGRGIADLATLPLDLAQGALRAASKGVDFVSEAAGGPELDLYAPRYSASQLVSEGASNVADRFGFDTIDPEDMSPSERLVYNVDRFAAGGGVGGSGLAIAAPKLAAGASPIARAVFSALAKPYAKSARPVVGDVAAGAGAGTFNSVYDENAPDWLRNSSLDPIARTLFDLLGGVTGATTASVTEGASRGLLNAGKKAVGANQETALPLNEVTGEPFSVPEADKAARLVQSRTDNPAVAAANIGDAVGELGPFGSAGELPTSALLSGDVGLITTENAARIVNPVPFVRRQQATNTRAREFVDSMAPPGSEGRNFTDFTDDLQRSRVVGATQELESAKAAEAAALSNRTTAGNDVTGAGGLKGDQAAVIDKMVVDETLLPMQEQNARLYASVDPQRSAMVDATPLIDQAKLVYQTLGDLNDASKVIPVGLLNRIAGATGRTDAETLLNEAAGLQGARPAPQIAIGDMVAVQPEISTTIARAERAGNHTLANNLRSLRDSMGHIIEEQAANGNEAARRALQANENYRATIGETFGRGPGDEGKRFRKDFNLDRFNRTTTPPSATASRFLQPGQPEKAGSLERIRQKATGASGGNSNSPAYDYLMADLAQSGVVDEAGALVPRRVRVWADRWGSVIDEVPGLRTRIESVVSGAEKGAADAKLLASDVRIAEAKLTSVQRDKGALGFVLGRNPENAIRSIFASPDPERAMQEIVGHIGSNKSATDGLKAAVRDYLVESKTTSAIEKTSTGANPVSFDQLDKLFKQHERVLAQVYSPEEMRTLRMAHKFLAPMKNRELPTSGALAIAGRGANLWTPLEIALKARFGVLKGGGVLRTLKLWAGTLPSDNEAVQQLVHQMWFDPELAQHLLTRNLKELDTPYWNAKLNRLLAVGAGVRGDDESGGDGNRVSLPSGL